MWPLKPAVLLQSDGRGGNWLIGRDQMARCSGVALTCGVIVVGTDDPVANALFPVNRSSCP